MTCTFSNRVGPILQAFFHPYHASGNSQVQNDMLETLDKWLGGLGHEDGQKTLQSLTKASATASPVPLGQRLIVITGSGQEPSEHAAERGAGAGGCLSTGRREQVPALERRRHHCTGRVRRCRPAGRYVPTFCAELCAMETYELYFQGAPLTAADSLAGTAGSQVVTAGLATASSPADTEAEVSSSLNVPFSQALIAAL